MRRVAAPTNGLGAENRTEREKQDCERKRILRNIKSKMEYLKLFEEKKLDEFHLINRTYQNFEEFLLHKGLITSNSTNLGFWAGTPLKETFTVFNTLWNENNWNNNNFIKPKSRKYKMCRSFCDLGSGDGRVVLLASLFNIKKAVGIESDLWLHNVSNHIKEHINLEHFWKTKFIRNDFSRHNVRGYDYKFISPDKPFYRGMEEKFQKELNGKLIVYGHETFHPTSLKLLQRFNLNGELFCVYEK